MPAEGNFANFGESKSKEFLNNVTKVIAPTIGSDELLPTMGGGVANVLNKASSPVAAATATATAKAAATATAGTAIKGDKPKTSIQSSASQKIGEIAEKTQTAGMDLLKDINNLAELSEKDFPKSDSIMGLPPIGASGSESEFSVFDQLVSSFPILTLQPFKMFGVKQEGKFDREVLSVIYKFAIIPTTDVSYGHSNQYGPSSIAQTVEQLMNSETMSQVRQLAFVSGGALGNAFRAGASTTTEAINQTLKALYVNMPDNVKNNPIGGPMAAVGMDVLRGLLLGARAAFPNIWQNSQTGMSWNFTVELRTFATDPTSNQYKKDILLPLECLLALSLPVGGSQIAYTEPPYIKAQIPNVLNVEIGAISNMNWSIPLSELNLAGVPRHVQVTFTITDLYNIMVQGSDMTKNNVDIPTKDRMLSWIAQPPSKKVANTHVWKNEFIRPGGETGNLEAIPDQLMSSLSGEFSAPWTSLGSASAMSFFSDDNFMSNVLGNFGQENFLMNMSSGSGFLNMSIPNLNNFTAMSLPNVTDIMGDIDVMTLMNGGSIPFNINDFTMHIAGAAPILSSQLSTLGSSTIANLESLFNGAGNMSKITSGLMDMVPSNMLNALGQFNGSMVTEIFNGMDSSLIDFTPHLQLINETVRNLPMLLPSVVSGEELLSDNLVKTVMTNVSKTNTQLDNLLRLTYSLQETLYRSCEAMVSQVLNNANVHNELCYMNKQMRALYGGSETVVSQFNTSMRAVSKVAGAVMSATTIQNIMSNGLRTNNRSCGILMEAKK